MKNAPQIFMCLMNVFQCGHYLKKYTLKKRSGAVFREEKPSTLVQSTEQEVKNLLVEQEHHLQESALRGQLKIISNFINVTFLGTETFSFNFLIIKSSKINGSLHYFLPGWKSL